MPNSESPASMLGATIEEDGVTFRLTAPHATGVSLCLFDGDDPNTSRETDRIAMARDDRRHRDGDGLWTAKLRDIHPGQLYGYRVEGPYQPSRGNRFNPAKLLVDPRAGAVAGQVTWSEALLGSDARDSAPFQARSVVVDPAFDWQGDRPPHRPWGETVIYECHVRGLTKTHPEVPVALRGKFLGLSSPPIVDHLTSLGVTALELMPVQHFVSERHLMERGRTNYWGYSPLAWFAPYAGYGSGDGSQAVREFQTMVRELHRAGLEVILDVVFNHTGEGGASGPTLSLRGIDNALYYLLDPEEPRRYLDFTGCGNTVDASRPQVGGLIRDCLRYWVEGMHVDGFRFDLATTLGRENGGFSGAASLLEAVSADPVFDGVKLIAEPWDLGPGGYQLGAFPPGWSGWNDRFRDTARSFWRGDAGRRADLATRIAGSADLFSNKRRGPLGGINYVTCHDGFTLEDLVSYERKHNEANGEDNRDGRKDNLSRNWGAEGPTESEEILSSRDRAKRNLMATLVLSSGVPMLAHGDEFGRTQKGNNNTYCQDGPLTWLHWEEDGRGVEFCGFVQKVLALRRSIEVFGRERFPRETDVEWFGSAGKPLSEEDWRNANDRVLGVGWTVGPSGRFLLYMNAGTEARSVTLPARESVGRWRERLNTAASESARILESRFELPAQATIALEADRSSIDEGPPHEQLAPRC